MFKDYLDKSNFEETGFSYTLSLISGKYKMVILYCLMEFEIVRYNELKRYIGTISHKTLSTSLKELEKDQAHQPQGISADSSEGGVQLIRKRKIPDGNSGPIVHMGRKNRI